MKRNGARPLAAPRCFSAGGSSGFTLIELVIVLVISVVLVYFVVRTLSPKQTQALQQAERLRGDIRHVQMLAMTWSQTLRLTAVAAVPGVSPARYEVTCASGSATPPCNGASPVTDPATGKAYRITLESDLDIGATTLDFDPLGRPRSGGALTSTIATFSVTGGSPDRSVTVAPVTGFAALQ